jgi:hypothetical protein
MTDGGWEEKKQEKPHSANDKKDILTPPTAAIPL